MGFVKVNPLPISSCGHNMPDDKEGKAFGVGTIWRCDTCGAAFRYDGGQWGSQYNESYWNAKWTPAPAFNGPDKRPLPLVPEVDDPVPMPKNNPPGFNNNVIGGRGGCFG